jgi:hypothetical protein
LASNCAWALEANKTSSSAGIANRSRAKARFDRAYLQKNATKFESLIGDYLGELDC